MSGPRIRLPRERMLVVADDGRLSRLVRDRYAEWDVSSSASYLSGIHALARHPARVVLAYVDPALNRLDAAVAGLREAAGEDARIVLCCPPEVEVRVRRVLGRGADDYVVYPIQTDELDAALGYARRPLPTGELTPAASMEELRLLGEVLADLDAAPSQVLGRLAELLLAALKCRSIVLSVEPTTVVRGEHGCEPVLVEPITVGGEAIGQIAVSSRRGRPYSAADARKLLHYATLAGHLVEAASKHRNWRELALTDEVTGLPNRRRLQQFLAERIERAREEQFRVTVLVFDIDDFKTYNDTFGHDVGDDVLRLTGALFRRHCREHDLVARYGGDEFAVVFWDAELPRVAGSRHPANALAVLSRCTEALQRQDYPALGPDARGVLTVSGGLATFPWHADNADDLLRQADEALLQAKRAGKNRIYLIGQEGE